MAISNDGTNYFIGSNYHIESTTAIAKSEITTLLDNTVGTARYKFGGNGANSLIHWRPNITEETMTSGINVRDRVAPDSFSPSVGARFSLSLYLPINSISPNYFFAAIETGNGATSQSSGNKIYTAATNTNGFNTVADSTYLCYATGNDRSLATFVFKPDTGYHLFVWTGALVEFPAIFGSYPRNCAAIAIGQDADGDAVADIIRVGLENSTTKQQVLTSGGANYAISCSDSQTPGTDLWATDLYLIDDDPGNSNPATGRCSNLILAKGASFAIASVYSLNTPHKDGGSNAWMCVANYGTDKILMRISDGS